MLRHPASNAQRASSERGFGMLFCVVFAVLGLLPLRHGDPAQLTFLTIAALFLLAAVAVPRCLRPLNRAWSWVGSLLHRVTNPLILGAVFLLVVTPIGLLLRLMGKDVLNLSINRASESYWIRREPPGPAPESLPRQF